jgi:hypothetical protein
MDRAALSQERPRMRKSGLGLPPEGPGVRLTHRRASLSHGGALVRVYSAWCRGFHWGAPSVWWLDSLDGIPGALRPKLARLRRVALGVKERPAVADVAGQFSERAVGYRGSGAPGSLKPIAA